MSSRQKRAFETTNDKPRASTYSRIPAHSALSFVLSSQFPPHRIICRFAALPDGEGRGGYGHVVDRPGCRSSGSSKQETNSASRGTSTNAGEIPVIELGHRGDKSREKDGQRGRPPPTSERPRSPGPAAPPARLSLTPPSLRTSPSHLPSGVNLRGRCPPQRRRPGRRLRARRRSTNAMRDLRGQWWRDLFRLRRHRVRSPARPSRGGDRPSVRRGRRPRRGRERPGWRGTGRVPRSTPPRGRPGHGVRRSALVGVTAGERRAGRARLPRLPRPRADPMQAVFRGGLH